MYSSCNLCFNYSMWWKFTPNIIQCYCCYILYVACFLHSLPSCLLFYSDWLLNFTSRVFYTLLFYLTAFLLYTSIEKHLYMYKIQKNYFSYQLGCLEYKKHRGTTHLQCIDSSQTKRLFNSIGQVRVIENNIETKYLGSKSHRRSNAT
jgi:hypothetical protein